VKNKEEVQKCETFSVGFLHTSMATTRTLELFTEVEFGLFCCILIAVPHTEVQYHCLKTKKLSLYLICHLTIQHLCWPLQWLAEPLLSD